MISFYNGFDTVRIIYKYHKSCNEYKLQSCKMVEIHKKNKRSIIALTILGVVFIVIGVAILIPGAVFYTRSSEDTEDTTNFRIGLTLLLIGGISGISGVTTILVLIAVVFCFLSCCPKVLTNSPSS